MPRHESRLARTFGEPGSELYAWEELIAEMGSAMLSVIVGVPSPDFPNIANYLASWRNACSETSRPSPRRLRPPRRQWNGCLPGRPAAARVVTHPIQA